MNIRNGIRIFRGYRVPHFKIIEHKKYWFAASGVIIAISIGALAIKGLNYSLDFKGGAQLAYLDKSGVSADAVRSTLDKAGRTDSEVQLVNGSQISVRTTSLSDMSETDRQNLLDELAKQAGVTSDDINIQDVGPSWGAQISQKMIQALVIFLVLVSIYISFRFEWKMALAAQAALFHDIIITAGIYALVGRQVTPNTVIAILTILGYSLYDTVVIFDKIQENTQSTALIARETYSGVVNMSLNQTFMRSVNTSLVVLLPILSLLLFGGDTLKDFAFALFVGVLSGTYSSIFVASPILTVLKEREPRFQAVRVKAEQRAGGQAAKTRREPAAASAAGSTTSSSSAAASGTRRPSTPVTGVATGSRANLPASVTQPRKTKKSTAKKRRRR
jgi:preprotein translocase SecF subunit